MNQEHSRSRPEIMRELLALTKDMANQRNDEDFLIASVDKRQALIDEFDRMEQEDSALPDDMRDKIRAMASEAVALDRIIASALEDHYKRIKDNLTSNTQQQRLLNYTNHAMSSSGSYMDYKK